MKKRRKKKDDLLFRGLLAASFLLFWSGLVVLGLVSRAMNDGASGMVRTETIRAFDPSSDPEGFSLYADFTRTDSASDAKVRAGEPDPRLQIDDSTGSTALSNAPDSRRLVKDN